MDTRTAQVARGWKVVGSDGENIGEVEETREDHLVVTRGMLLKHHLYIPIDRMTQVGDGKVVVNITAGNVEEEGWRYPPNAGFAHEKPAYPEVPETTTMQAAGYSAGRLSAPEPQGAVLDDGLIDADEVPNEDVGPGEDDPEALGRDENVR